MDWGGGCPHFPSLSERPSESRAEDKPPPACCPVKLSKPLRANRRDWLLIRQVNMWSVPSGGETQGLRDREWRQLAQRGLGQDEGRHEQILMFVFILRIHQFNRQQQNGVFLALLSKWVDMRAGKSLTCTFGIRHS